MVENLKLGIVANIEFKLLVSGTRSVNEKSQRLKPLVPGSRSDNGKEQELE